MEQSRLLELLQDMSLEEKIGQLVQLPNSFFEHEAVLTGPAMEFGIGEKEIYEAGSTLSVFGAKTVRKVQESYMEKQPHHIPLLFMADVINGYRTSFPIPLAQGCSFDPKLVKRCARAAAREASYDGLHVTFSPMVDLVKDARWGRVMESTGEDAYLNGVYAKEIVEGYQGENLKEDGTIASCVKHFAAYGAPQGAREYNTVELSKRTLRDEYLPAYQAGIDAGSALMMTSFNTLDRIPATGNKWLMREILRKEMGFDGVLISDWAAIEELVFHGIAEDKKEAARLALDAGVDIDMCTNSYVRNLKSLIQDGTLKEEQLDEAVLRVLTLKNKLGLFENPYRFADEQKAKETILCEEHRRLAREAAASSIVLLKNKGQILPLPKEGKKIAFIGPYVEQKRLYGAWSLRSEEKDTVSVKDGILDLSPDDTITFAQGCYLFERDEKLYGFNGLVKETRIASEERLLEAAVREAENADIVVLALGEHAYHTGEGGSRTNIKLPKAQRRLLKEVRRVNDNVVVVLFHGRPLDIREVTRQAKAVVAAWFPGTEGGHAVCDILFGEKNPSGRLSMSFPYSVGQVPLSYNHFSTGRPYNGDEKNRFQSKYLDAPVEALYPFGYGLSYTEFSYSGVRLSKNMLSKETEGDTIIACVDVKNTGSREGTETVQLYIRDLCGSVVRPIRELKGFSKITLAPGKTETVEFAISEEMLRFTTAENRFESEKGTFVVYIGENSATDNSAEFVLI